MGKKNVYFVRIGSTPRPSSGQLNISRHQLETYLNLEPPKLHLYQLTKDIAAEIAPHIYSALKYLRVIFGKSILFNQREFANQDKCESVSDWVRFSLTRLK